MLVPFLSLALVSIHVIVPWKRGSSIVGVKVVGVIGAGVMGVGVSHNLAQTNHQVILLDVAEDILAQAEEKIE